MSDDKPHVLAFPPTPAYIHELMDCENHELMNHGVHQFMKKAVNP